MSRKTQKKLQIDTRNATDIESKIKELSEQYETGWVVDYDHADVGTAIARLFAREMEENIGRVNHVLDRYHTEFVNMLDISLLAAKPSSAIVVMDMLSGTVPGVAVPKGTKLYAENGEEPFIFETDHSLYVSSSRITSSFMTDGEEKRIVPLYGRFSSALLPGELKRSMDEEDEDALPPTSMDRDYGGEEGFLPFRLFGETDGVEKNAVSFFHPTVFDTGLDEIYVRIEGNPSLCEDIEKGKYAFYYNDFESGLTPVDECARMENGETFVLKKYRDSGFHELVLVAKNPPESSKKISRISFSSKGKAQAPEVVNSGSTDFDTQRFAPFTDTLSLYAECYIGHDRYFGKAGSKITVSFDLLFEEHRISLNEEEQDAELKIIKRRPNTARQEVYIDSYPQEIAVEYFNGTGWRKLPLSEDPRMLFFGEQSKRVELSFVCPSDWEETTSGSYEGRSIRFTLTKSDNCYVRPAVHHYPIIKDLQLSYSYEETFVDAQSAKLYYGLSSVDISDKLADPSGYLVFQKSDYEEDALYIGFSRQIENGPASILFQLRDGLRFSGIQCRFEYFGYDGFRPLKVLDYTQDFTRSGVVMFMPPSDMKKSTLEGNSCFWIRVLRVKKEDAYEDRKVLPHIENIVLNAVSVSNVETRPEVPIYIDEAFPNMRFALGANNVLDADVWVNEMGRYSMEVMRDLFASDPDKYEIQEDEQGNITAFFVRWSEAERLETSEDPRVYLLDRLSNELIFGDGVHTWMPKVVDDTAVRFSVRCTSGAAGNVAAGTITESMGALNFIGSITNPVKAYGGSNIESLENALERGAGILSSRNRLVSMDDFTRAILSYSDTIDQVAGITGVTIDGREAPGEVTFLLLMKDFAEGSFAFHRIVGGLQKELLSHCELTLTSDNLHIVEPIYVDISVSVWINVVSMDDSFEIQGLLQECLQEYLNPIGYGSGQGWKIGTIPKRPQILMRLGVLKSRAIVKKSVMIARYTDASGEHEVDLNDLKVTPFMVCRSGNHEVHIIY